MTDSSLKDSSLKGTCACSSCFPKRGAFVGDKLFVKTDLEGSNPDLFPPNLAKDVKVGKFEVLITDKAKAGPSAFLKMPSGLGQQITVNGKKEWGWWFFYSDLYGDEDPKNSSKGDDLGKVPEEKKVLTQEFLAGDIVEVKEGSKNILDPRLQEKHFREGFRVLGKDNNSKSYILELPDKIGATRSGFGYYTNIISPEDLKLKIKFEPKVGDYVRVIDRTSSSHGMNSSITDAEHELGFKVIAVKGDTLYVEVPPGKGITDYDYPGKTLNRIAANKIEAAPLIYRPGDQLAVPSNGEISSKNSSYTVLPPANKPLTVVSMTGKVGSHAYVVKDDQGHEWIVSGFAAKKFVENVSASEPKSPPAEINQPKSELKQEKAISSPAPPPQEVLVQSEEDMKKIKVNDKVFVTDRDYLPASLSDRACRGTFEVLSIEDGSAALKMPRNCKEAEHDSDYGCRVWYIDYENLSKEKPEEDNDVENEMDDRGTFVERFQENLGKGATRAVGRKLTKAVKAGLLRAMEAAGKADGLDESQLAVGIKMFAGFMESEFGNALVSSVLGLAIAHGAPHIPIPLLQDERLQDLADDMTAEGSALAMEKVFDIAMTYIAPGLSEILQGLPPKEATPKKVRIKAPGAPAKASRRKTKEVDAEHEAAAEEETKEGNRRRV